MTGEQSKDARSLRVIAWNIRSGGGERGRSIADAIAKHEADVAILIEYRPKGSAQLLNQLQGLGYPHAVLSKPVPKIGGVAIVSRRPIVEEPCVSESDPFASRIMIARVPDADLVVCGLYGPLESEAFDDCWRSLLGPVRERADQPVLVAGDLNTGAPTLDAPGKRFFGSQFFAELSAAGYTDLWRREHGDEAREHSWFGRTNGYRIDHAFASQRLLPRVEKCWYSHGEREQKMSDHSAVLVDLTVAE